MISSEIARIKKEYERRRDQIPSHLYSAFNVSYQFSCFQRLRHVLRILTDAGIFSLSEKRILDVGCGTGGWLVDFMNWGANPSHLHGIDLLEEDIQVARSRLPHSDLRVGDVSSLCWPDDLFDIVFQTTVFSSILDAEMKRKIASEMIRVVNKKNGFILWYDFFVDNPRNPNVKGVRKKELSELFEGSRILLKKVTLAPPITRSVVPYSWILALLLEKIPFLRTHYLAVISANTATK